MKIKTSYFLLTVGSVVTIIYLSQVTLLPTAPKPLPSATWVTFSKPWPCDVKDLNYSNQMKSQIQELCVAGLSREEAIQNLQIMYRTPGINPERAVELVKLAKAISLHKQSPDPWK